jgi:hypothetical protein
MFQNAQLSCDHCRQRILVDGKPSVRVLVEFVKGGGDLHYCENCLVVAVYSAVENRASAQTQGSRNDRPTHHPLRP